MKTFSKYTVFLAVVLLLSANRGYSCAYTEYGEDIRISMFRIFNENMGGFYPFKYSANLFNSTYSGSSKDRERNIQEWIQELNPTIRSNDVDLILYKCDPVLFYQLFHKNKLGTFFKGNTFIEELLKEKNKEILKYVAIAKGIEYLEEYHNDPWEEYTDKTYDFNSQLNQSISDHLEDVMLTDLSPFLRKRYAFQYVRMLYQNNDYFGCKEVYFTNFNPDSNETILNPWALHYCAIAEMASGDTTEANYHMALVFDRCDDKKFRMYRNFLRDSDHITQSLALAKSPQEKAAILTMSIVNNPGKTIQTVLDIEKLVPDYYALDFLLLREINKLEDWLLTPSLTLNKPSVSLDTAWRDGPMDYLKKNRETDMAYLEQVIAFAKRLMAQRGNSDYLKMALAHLYILDEQNSTALSLLPESGAPLSSVLAKQNIIEQLILLSAKDKIVFFDNREEAGKLFSELDQMYQKGQVDNMTMYSLCRRYAKAMFFNNDIVRSTLFLKLANTYNWSYYLYDNNRMKFSISKEFSYYLLDYMDQIAAPEDFDEMIRFIQTENRNKLDFFLARQEFPSVEQCLDMKGSKLFRQGRYAEALSTWESLEDEYWINNGEFESYLCHDIEKPKEIYPESLSDLNIKRVNKADILSKLMSLEVKAYTSGRHQDEYMLKLANAWFNVSYYGNAWMLAHYYKSVYPESEVSGVGFYETQNNIQCDSMNYIHLQNAISLYNKVIADSDDRELKLEAIVMLELIKYQKHYTTYRYDWDNEHPYTPDNSNIFWKEYEDTDFYQRMYTTCPRFEAFVNM